MNTPRNVPPLRVHAGFSLPQSEIGFEVLTHAVRKAETQDAGSLESVTVSDLHEERGFSVCLFSHRLGNFPLNFEWLMIISARLCTI